MSQCRRVRSQLLAQDIYVRDCVPLKFDENKYIKDKYVELERIQEGNGFKDVLVEREYPHTAESLNSYAESADYRADINAAMASSPRGVNLGDMTAGQEYLKLDSSEIAARLAFAREQAALLEKELALSKNKKEISEVVE